MSVAFCYLAVHIIQAIGINDFGGAKRFTALTVVYSVGIALGAVFLIMYFCLFRKYKIKYGVIYLIVVIIMMPSLVYGSVNYYKDLFNGKTEIETEIYDIHVESFYEEHPDVPKTIILSRYGNDWFTISDETYNDLITNNPHDKTRLVHDAVLDRETYPHIHRIIVKFYENTEIVDSVRIVYDEN
ncbi:MAG: hypothetical protein NC299_17760 [Lachnospiraceae bacterium]|nr:hypothetical protein [Ruminococcus sp.]MCM1277174.1 hypothetical protein [Lachnospiraceae bacterium]